MSRLIYVMNNKCRIISRKVCISDLKEAHPNTAQLRLTGVTGRKLEVVGESIGGSRINIAKIDGIDTNFSGDYPTLVVHNIDQPGHVSEVTSLLAHSQ